MSESARARARCIRPTKEGRGYESMLGTGDAEAFDCGCTLGLAHRPILDLLRSRPSTVVSGVDEWAMGPGRP